MIELLFLVLVAVVIGVITQEATGWLGYLSKWLATRAASRMAPPLAEEYEETYLGELETMQNRPLTAVVVSLRMLLGSTETARIIDAKTPGAAALAIKRVFDVWFSLLVLIVCAPVFAAIWLAIRLTTPGPAIYGHKRYGHRGQVFDSLKFRTMVQDGPQITPIGRFLRRTSLDELPQFWNILRGDMSVVGPRPRDQGLSHLLGPLEVKPGMTGLGQISEPDRLDVDMHRLDEEYVRRWSLRMDLLLILKTPLAALRKRRVALDPPSGQGDEQGASEE